MQGLGSFQSLRSDSGQLPAKSCIGTGPKAINVKGISAVARALKNKVLSLALSTTALFSFSSLAHAQDRQFSGHIELPFGTVNALDVVQFATFAGAMGAALLTAGWLIRDRSKMVNKTAALRTKCAELSMVAQRNEALLNLKDQRIIIWDGYNANSEVIGLLPDDTGAPLDRSQFLAFGRWLRADSVMALEHAIRDLREKAITFDMVVETVNGTLLDVNGRTSGGLAIARFIHLQGVQAECAVLKTENHHLYETLNLLRSLMNQLDQAVWIRDDQGRLEWVNDAYIKAVEAADAIQAVQEGRELFGTQARERMERERMGPSGFRSQLPTVIAGDRHIFDVTEVPGEAGSAGFASNVSEIEQVREELQRTLRSHAETLDQLSTAVAIFDPEMKLQFFNQAFSSLWSLDTPFLESHPSNALLFDRLRSDGKLPEQPEWRRWKDSMLSAYRSVEPQEHMWHLPDTRIMRVVANPHPKGGVTWFFENMTEKFELEGRYNTLIRVQGETLDHLAEGVAVFGADGRIRLSNPAFANLWSLPSGMVVEGVHIADITRMTEKRAGSAIWQDFISAVTGFNDVRDGQAGHIELSDGNILSYALVPLPKGQTMLTFIDVTDTVRVERALKDKNEALEFADQIKNDFVQHVSYELRSPLTNIIGFTELLQTPSFGSLNERQHEYLGHISSSSSVLLTIVNDILDLATVDAGIMELEIDDVDVSSAINEAAERVAERLRDHNIGLAVHIGEDAERFRADANRLRQVLFNLLSNAANYAPEDSDIRLIVEREEDEIIFSVQDEGPGMPREVLDSVFQRFQSHNNGGRKRGAGLGLSIVKSFVELHGGAVHIQTASNSGTTVTCRFPIEARSFRAAAE